VGFDFRQFYFSPDGRVNRQQWWLRLMLPTFVIMVALRLLDLTLGTFDPRFSIGLLSGIFTLLVLVPAIMVHIKRFHDRDKSGWWVLIGLVPVLGGIWLLIELGTPGPNRYGPPVENGPADARPGA
jgi:uncharacterized membrane protein YhaH (DUF805 family)